MISDPVAETNASTAHAWSDQIMERTELVAVVAAEIMSHEDITARIGRI